MAANGSLSGYQVTLTPITEADQETLRAWRNSDDVRQFMVSQQIISAEQQQAWFQRVQHSDSERHFMIAYKGEPIGSANIKARGLGETLQSTRCIEPGLYIADKRYRNNILAFAPTLVLNDYCFETLKVDNLRAVVKADNQAALNYNQKIGYRIVNRGELVEISLNFEDYQQHSKSIKALLSRPAIRKPRCESN